MAFFTQLEQIILKFVWKHNRSQITKTTLRRKNMVGRIMFSDFKLYYQGIAMETVWYWPKNKHNRTE